MSLVDCPILVDMAKPGDIQHPLKSQCYTAYVSIGEDSDGGNGGDGGDIQCRGVLCKSRRTSAPLSITKPSPTNPPTLHTFALLKFILSLFEDNFH